MPVCCLLWYHTCVGERTWISLLKILLMGGGLRKPICSTLDQYWSLWYYDGNVWSQLCRWIRTKKNNYHSVNDCNCWSTTQLRFERLGADICKVHLWDSHRTDNCCSIAIFLRNHSSSKNGTIRIYNQFWHSYRHYYYACTWTC